MRRSPLERLRRAETAQPLVRPLWLRLAYRIGQAVPFLSIARYRPLLHRAGLAGRLRPEEIIGLKVLTGLSATLATLTFLPLVWQELGGTIALFTLLIIGGAGFVLPDAWLHRHAAWRRRQIFRTLPDFVDLLATTVSAGLSLDAAIDRIARRFPGPLGEEFQRYLWEVQLGRRRGEALMAMAERLDSDDLRLLAVTLTQADLFGLPIANVLRAQAEDLRDRRFQQARERARQAPMWMLPALALCFCPVLLLLIFVPLFLRMRETGLLRALGF